MFLFPLILSVCTYPLHVNSDEKNGSLRLKVTTAHTLLDSKIQKRCALAFRSVTDITTVHTQKPLVWHVRNYSSITIWLKSPRPTILSLITPYRILKRWAFSWNWKSQGKTRCQPRAPMVRPNVTRYLYWSRANHTVLMISASCLLPAKTKLAKSTIHQG